MGSVMAFSSQSVAGERVDAHQPEEQKPENDVNKIGHGEAPPGWSRVLAPRTRKRSIRDRTSERKESIRAAYAGPACRIGREGAGAVAASPDRDRASGKKHRGRQFTRAIFARLE